MTNSKMLAIPCNFSALIEEESKYNMWVLNCYLVQAEDKNAALLELKRRLDEETDEGAAGYRLCEMVEHK